MQHGNGLLLTPRQAATFINAGTFTANNGGIGNTGTGNLFVNNTGIFLSSPTPNATFSISSPFNNSGTVSVQTGILSLGGGDGGSNDRFF